MRTIPDMSAEGAAASPRTAQLPMAFTRAEFVRGATAAWAWYLLLATVLYALVLQGLVVVAAVIYLPWSVAALLVGSPLAYLLGLSLRRVRRMVVHVAAFAAFGAFVGVATTAVFAMTGADSDGQGGGALYYLLNTLASAPAVALGWHHAARRALRPERQARIEAATRLSALEDTR